MPESEPSFGDDWPLTKKRTEKAVEQLIPVEESFQACLVGIQTLAECFAAINETRAAMATLKENMSKLSDSGIASAAEKARWCHPEEDIFLKNHCCPTWRANARLLTT